MKTAQREIEYCNIKLKYINIKAHRLFSVPYALVLNGLGNIHKVWQLCDVCSLLLSYLENCKTGQNCIGDKRVFHFSLHPFNLFFAPVNIS
jgi:hypothetical protein